MPLTVTAVCLRIHVSILWLQTTSVNSIIKMPRSAQLQGELASGRLISNDGKLPSFLSDISGHSQVSAPSLTMDRYG